MKHPSIYALLLMIFCFANSCNDEVSEKQSEHYIKFYGSFLDDAVYDVQMTNDGGAVLTGSAVPPETGKEFILMKVDPYGNQPDWSPKKFESLLPGTGYAVKETSGGYLLAGSVDDTLTGKTNMIVFKTDQQGNMVWQWELKSNQGNDVAYCIDVDDQGRIILGGYREESGTGYIYSALLNSGGEFISRTDRNKPNWIIRSVYSDQNEEFLAFGNAVMAGSTASRFLLIRFNSSGNDLGNTLLQNENFSEVMNSSCRDEDNRYYLIGTAVNSSSASRKIHLKRIDQDTLTWSKTFGDDFLYDGKAVAVREDGVVLVVADKTVGADNRNIVLYLLNPEGQILSSREFGSTGDQVAEAIDYKDGRILIAGKNAFEGNSMITLIKTDRNGNLW